MMMKLTCVRGHEEVDVLLAAPWRDTEPWRMGVETETGIEEVKFARVRKGRPAIPLLGIARKALVGAGLDWAADSVRTADDGHLEVDMEDRSRYGWWSPCSGRTRSDRKWMVAGREIGEEVHGKIVDAFHTVSRWQDLPGASVRVADKQMPLQRLLEMMEGKVVSAASLKECRADGEDRPPFLPGDRVRGSFGEGVLEALNAKAKVRRPDGTYSNVSWRGMERMPDERPERPEDVHGSLDAAFSFVVEKGARLYRAATRKGPWAIPVFPQKGEKQRRREDAEQCECPICGWAMAQSMGYGEEHIFVCCMCSQRALVVDDSADGEISLLMMRRPAKNRFCLEEARCCANCGLFEFEVGRQGRRVTGYCRASNQCVQGFNACSWWFPRDPRRYLANMKQHVRNLAFGVDDERNTGRHDIRDTVYRAEDHEAQKTRADEAVDAYRRAHRWCMLELKGMAEKGTLRERATPEVREFYGRVLDEE